MGCPGPATDDNRQVILYETISVVFICNRNRTSGTSISRFLGNPCYSVPPSSGTYLGNVKESSSPRCITFLAGNDVKQVKCCMIFKDILISREGFNMLSHCYSIVCTLDIYIMFLILSYSLVKVNYICR